MVVAHYTLAGLEAGFIGQSCMQVSDQMIVSISVPMILESPQG